MAFCSLNRSARAREYYDAKLAAGKATTPHCEPWATAGSKSCGTACASASLTTKPPTQPTATARSNPRHEVDRGCLIAESRMRGLDRCLKVRPGHDVWPVDAGAFGPAKASLTPCSVTMSAR
jgi:hypothetical protein